MAALQNSQTNVRYADLFKVCTHYFGKTTPGEDFAREVRDPLRSEPYVNIQNKNGQAKPYQVKQVLAAIHKLEGKE